MRLQSLFHPHLERPHWLIPAVAFLLVMLDQFVEHIWLTGLSDSGHFASQLILYGILGSAMAWWGLDSLRRQIRSTENARQAQQRIHAKSTAANQRLEFLIQLNRQLSQAEDEEALFDVIFDLSQKVLPVLGCSLIRFDERGWPLPAIHRGTLEPAVFDAWTAHLSGTGNPTSCPNCSASQAAAAAPCPMLALPAKTRIVGQVHSLDLRRSGRTYGLLNIYTGAGRPPGDQEDALLKALSNEVALALESLQLRSRELALFSHLPQAHRHGTLQDELTDMLAHTIEALGASGGALYLRNSETTDLTLLTGIGQPLKSNMALIQRLANSVQGTEPPLIIHNLEQEESHPEGTCSLLVAALSVQNRSLGSLVLWADRPAAFNRRRARLITILGGQISLLVENDRACAQAEQRAALAERDRLAREIHDGLAQTLGYLKLRTAQTMSWLDDGANQRARDGLREIQKALAQAYVDTREAIDDLRHQPGEGQLNEWLEHTLADFQTLNGTPVQSTLPPHLHLAPEVSTQLLRIVQEALSNIRKHAGATRVWLEGQADASGLTLQIIDDGRGFEAADVPPIYQHGLRIMRERAELVGADFQTVSRPGAGTQVIIHIPVQALQKEVT